jgi:hypothetical protein
MFVLFIGLVLGGFFYIRHKVLEEKKDALSVTVYAKLVECAELCVYKYNYKDFVTVKHKKGIWVFTSESHSVVQFDAVTRAGISDMKKIDFAISKGGKKIAINLPTMEILGNDITSQEVISHSEGWVASDVTTQEIFDEISKKQSEILKELRSSGLLIKAEERVINILTETFTGMGFEEVIFK